MRSGITVLAALMMWGCDLQVPASQSASSAVNEPVASRPGKTVGAELTGYNHTDEYISAFYVNGEWGGNIFAGTGGGKFVCCVSLPSPWYPGLKVKVSWDDHAGKTHWREVEVPKYDPKTLSTFNVHFLRSGEIKVFAVRMTLRHRDYPLTGPESELKPGVPIEKVY